MGKFHKNKIKQKKVTQSKTVVSKPFIDAITLQLIKEISTSFVLHYLLTAFCKSVDENRKLLPIDLLFYDLGTLNLNSLYLENFRRDVES